MNKPKIFTFNLALFLFAVAFIGTGLRQLESGNFYAVGLAGFGIAAIAVVAGIRFRNWLDRRAIAN